MAELTKVAVRWGDDKYDRRYTDALRAQVPGLVVLGEDRPLLEPNRFKGWWSKLELTRPENADIRPCLYIDLDTFVMGDLSPFDELEPGLWLLRDFGVPKKSESGLMVMPGDTDYIWDRIETANGKRGDGAFFATFEHGILQDRVSGIRSYKNDQLYDDPGDARIVCFHGVPKPHTCKGWANDFWRAQINYWNRQ